MEVLVALFITAILTSLGASLVLGSIAGKERLDQVSAGARGLELAHAALMADLTQLSPRVARAPDGLPREWVFAGGEATLGGPLLAFSRAGWDNPAGAEPRGSIVYVEYLHEDDRLVRRSWTRMDPTTRTPVVERVLLTGVGEARVAFGRAGAWSRGFLAEPGGGAPEDLFPPLVELDLEIDGVGSVRQVFATGYGR